MKKIIIILLFLFSLIFLNLQFVSAEVTGDKSSQKSVCLYKIWCYDDKSNPDLNQINQCTQLQGHRVRLTSKEDSKSNPKAVTYIVDCISHDDPVQKKPVITCTTGNTVLDLKLFNADHFGYLKNLIKYSFDADATYGVFNVDKKPIEKLLPPPVGVTPQPVMTDEVGNIPTIEWQSFSPGNYSRKFYAINIIPPGQNENAAGLGQKLAEILKNQSAKETCASVAWDPEGRVFDSVTLEPIPFANVTLLKKYGTEYSDARVTEIGITNPFLTDADGGFSFIVNDGSYKLNPVAANYSFPINSLDKISANYKKIYSGIYPVESGEEIIQKGKLEHRDIALLPNISSGYNYDLKVFSFFNDLNKSTDQIIFEGRVSHPQTKITIYSLKNNNSSLVRNRNIFTSYTDKLGKFSFKINNTILAIDETFGEIEFEKVDLTGNNKIFNNPISFQFDSIPNHLEGFAYNNIGNKLASVNVGIYTDTSSSPYYQTTTDSNGYFQITSEYLPTQPFKIKYSSSIIQSINITPNQFIIKNSKYLTGNNINLSAYKASSETANITRVPKANPTDNFAREQIGGNKKETTDQNSQNNNSSIILVAAVLLLLIGGVGAMLGVYALHKKQSPTI